MALKSYRAPKPETWATIGGKKLDGTKNPTSIEGYYVNREDNVPSKFKEGGQTVVTLQTKDGTVGVRCSGYLKNLLDDSERSFLKENGRPAYGARTVITATGVKDSGKGFPMKTYDLQFDNEDMADGVVPTPTLTVDEDEDVSDEIDTDEVEDTPEYEAPAKVAAAPKASTSVSALIAKRKK